MIELTEFQVETEDLLQKHLCDVGFAMRNRKIDGTTESFVAGEVEDISVWIYRDGACAIGRGVDRVFEECDFDSLAALQQRPSVTTSVAGGI